MNSLELVREFHNCFNIENRETPGIPDKRTCLIRLQLLQEELGELAHGLASGDVVECLDALGDLQYVLDGTFLALGLDKYKMEAVREIHRSNMTKLGDDGKPILNEAGRVVKSSNYEPPNLKKLLE